jgi:hypothetical protein
MFCTGSGDLAALRHAELIDTDGHPIDGRVRTGAGAGGPTGSGSAMAADGAAPKVNGRVHALPR